MEGGSNIVKTSSSKRSKSTEKDQDRISQLPDSILVHILSFLPTKDAVKTVLVPRFRYLWTYLRTLSFDQCEYHDCNEEYKYGPEYDERFRNLINHVLALHENATIDNFHLKLELNYYYSRNEALRDDPAFEDYVSRERRMANEVDTWVRFAMRKQVKVLDLDLLGCAGMEPDVATYQLPNIVLSNNYLVDLKLAGCEIKPVRQILLKSLKKLLLKEVVLSDKIMDQILCGCLLLEELSLIKCYGLRKLSFTNPNIKSLMVILEKEHMKLSCPNLKSLEVAGSIEFADLANVSSLVDASLFFSYRFKCPLKEYREVKTLFKKLSHTKIVKLCTRCILVFTIWQLRNFPCSSFSWKSVVLNISMTKWHHPGISCLLRSSPSLETLKMYIYPGLHHIYTNNDAQWMKAYDFDGGNYWNSQEGTFHCLQHHLKTVMIYGYITEPYVIQFTEFLLKNAIVLEKMVISTKKTFQPAYQDWIFCGPIACQKDQFFTSENLLEFSRKLLSLPRASPHAVIYFS